MRRAWRVLLGVAVLGLLAAAYLGPELRVSMVLGAMRMC